MPLVRRGGVYSVAHIPRSPGFVGDIRRIYRATDEILAQYYAVRKP
jgi:hypothetical protein